MKKLLLSLAILGVMTFAACSEDEKDYTPHYTMCQHCDIPEEAGYEVCTGDNGNAYVGNADTGIPLVQYFSLFCDNIPDDGIPPIYTNCVMCISDAHPEGQKVCKGENGNAWTFVGETATDTEMAYQAYLDATCTSTTPVPVTFSDCVTCSAVGEIPEEEVCKGSDGHAYVNEADMGMSYSDYIDLSEMAGSNCN